LSAAHERRAKGRRNASRPSHAMARGRESSVRRSEEGERKRNLTASFPIIVFRKKTRGEGMLVRKDPANAVTERKGRALPESLPGSEVLPAHDTGSREKNPAPNPEKGRRSQRLRRDSLIPWGGKEGEKKQVIEPGGN